MLIVHIVRQFYPGVGGLENHVLDLARAQVAAGHDVRVVTLNRIFSDPAQTILAASDHVEGIQIYRIPYAGSKRYPIALSVLRYLEGADIAHVHAIDFFFDFLAWTKPLHRRTLIATTHGGFFHTSYAAGLKRLWFNTITRASSWFYDAIIACSSSDYERFSSLGRDRLVWIEDGVNTDKFRDAGSPEFRKSILWIGRFSSNKRLDRLVSFVQALAAGDSEWKLTIAGRPDDLSVADVEALVSEAGLNGSVAVLESPPDAELRQAVRDSSFIASSSDYEGFGMTAVEGLSAGLFPLLSDIPPYRRLVAATGLGVLLDYANPAEAALTAGAAIASFDTDFGERRKACIEAASAYDWTHISRQTDALYKDAIRGQLSESSYRDR